MLYDNPFWQRTKEPRGEKERREIVPSIMATSLAPLAHALRLDQNMTRQGGDDCDVVISQVHYELKLMNSYLTSF